MKQLPMIQHSGHGITATVLGSLAICIFLLNTSLWLFFRVDNQLEYPHQVLLASLAGFNLIIIFFGLASSFKGILQSGRNKTLPLIGLGLNAFTLVLYLIVIITYLSRKYF
ncbi:MAG: hypothetical protein HZA49_02555 [Planctomycetes bacterium]|nr:hypothetical protein [Planctomycetota bacterium]